MNIKLFFPKSSEWSHKGRISSKETEEITFLCIQVSGRLGFATLLPSWANTYAWPALLRLTANVIGHLEGEPFFVVTFPAVWESDVFQKMGSRCPLGPVSALEKEPLPLCS